MSGALFVLGGLLGLFVSGFLGLGPVLYEQAGEPMVDQSAFLARVLCFLAGGWILTTVRFVGPKRVHVMTFLGTYPIQQLKTGIRLTLPWPFAFTHEIVHTDVRNLPIRVQVKSKDELVFHLPVGVQWYVSDALRFAVEREGPIGQMENLVTAAVRSGATRLTLQGIYDDKDEIQRHANSQIAAELASFGVTIKELVIQDPELDEKTARKLSAIREAEFDRQAAVNEAEAIYAREVGHARAEAESTRLKGAALASFRLLIAEGNAAAVAVMQGRLAIEWEDVVEGEGDMARTIKRPKFVLPSEHPEGAIVPEIDIDPTTILDFFKVVDGNDAIRDASSQPGTTVVVPAQGGSDVGLGAAVLREIQQMGSRPLSNGHDHHAE